MKRIETRSTGPEHVGDYLDGRELVDGEMLRIEWPDGSRTEEPIRVEVEAFDYDDHTLFKVPGGRNCKAYLERRMQGFRVRVFLRGPPALAAERI